MKRTALEKGFVFVLFVLVIVIFSFAERDTQKAFEKFNTKSTVEAPRQTENYTAETSDKKDTYNKATHN